jgi:hypothetical protein
MVNGAWPLKSWGQNPYIQVTSKAFYPAGLWAQRGFGWESGRVLFRRQNYSENLESRRSWFPYQHSEAQYTVHSMMSVLSEHYVRAFFQNGHKYRVLTWWRTTKYSDPSRHVSRKNIHRVSPPKTFPIWKNSSWRSLVLMTHPNIYEPTMDVNMTVYRDVAPCNLVEVYRRFWGTCCLHH